MGVIALLESWYLGHSKKAQGKAVQSLSNIGWNTQFNSQLNKKVPLPKKWRGEEGKEGRKKQLRLHFELAGHGSSDVAVNNVSHCFHPEAMAESRFYTLWG